MTVSVSVSAETDHIYTGYMMAGNAHTLSDSIGKRSVHVCSEHLEMDDVQIVKRSDARGADGERLFETTHYIDIHGEQRRRQITLWMDEADLILLRDKISLALSGIENTDYPDYRRPRK